jgi:hypothetical protein
MATYLGMQTDIMDELADQGTISLDQVKKAIARAISHYERRDWWFMQETATFASVAGQEYYSSAALSDIPNMVEIVSLKRASTDEKLLGVSNQEIEEFQSGTNTGSPTYFAFWDSQIRLYPVPATAETLKVTYFKRIAALSADADENAWTTTAEELIRQSAKRRIAMDVLHDDGLASRCNAAEEVAFNALIAENRRRRTNKTLRPAIPPLTESFDILVG